MDCSWQPARAAPRLRFLQQFDVADLAIIQEHGLDAASTEHVSAPMTTRRARHTSQCCRDVTERFMLSTHSYFLV